MKKLLLLAIVVLGFSAVSFGQAETTVTASGTIIVPISIKTVSEMVFGDIAVQGGVSGTVVLPVTGNRIPSTGLTLPTTAVFSPAALEVSGMNKYTYSIEIPTLIIVNGTGTAAGENMEITAINSTPTTVEGVGSGILDETTGKDNILIGGTLNVKAAQKPGPYSNTYKVTVNYN